MRNRRDGSIEVLFSNPATAVEEMINACQYGPSAAEILQVELETSDEPELVGLEQHPTAE